MGLRSALAENWNNYIQYAYTSLMNGVGDKDNFKGICQNTKWRFSKKNPNNIVIVTNEPYYKVIMTTGNKTAFINNPNDSSIVKIVKKKSKFTDGEMNYLREMGYVFNPSQRYAEKVEGRFHHTNVLNYWNRHLKNEGYFK